MRARLPDPAPIPEAPAGMPLDAVLESTTPLVARGLAAHRKNGVGGGSGLLICLL